MHDPIYVKDSRGLYLCCNDAYADFAGVEKDHIGQKEATDVLPDGAAQKSHMDDLRALAADEPMETEEWVVDRRGGIFVIIVCVFLSLNHLLVCADYWYCKEI